MAALARIIRVVHHRHQSNYNACGQMKRQPLRMVQGHLTRPWFLWSAFDAGNRDRVAQRCG
jgi:hypothetical protein